MSEHAHTRRTVLRGIGAGAVLLGGVTTATADDQTDDQGDGTTAEVRVGHLSPDTPAVDVYVGASGLDPTDEDTDPVVEGLEYPNFAPDAAGTYLDLEKGTYDISVTAAGQPGVEPIDVDGFEVGANRDYTILAVGELAPEGDEPGIQALPLVDNDDDETALPPADATLVRFVHASPDAGTVDLVVERDGEEVTTVGGVDFSDATGYLELEPGEYTVDVGPGALEVPLDLDAGTKVSGYVIGNADPEDAPEDGPATADAELDAVTTLDATSPANDRGRDDDEDEDDEDEDDEEDEDGQDGDRGRGRGR